MRMHLNTLFVTTEGAYVSRDGETVVVKVENDVRLRAPVHTLASLVTFGRVSCSPPLLALCGERGVSVTFLSEHGRFLARVEGPVSGNVLLRREQYRRSESAQQSAALARAFVAGKIANERTVLQRAVRDHPPDRDEGALDGAVRDLSTSGRTLVEGLPLDGIRGVEGAAARAYFEVFDRLVTAQRDDFRFTSRSRRPPLDRINALLSFVYVLLLHDVRSALESVGLDPQVGYLHRDRPGRPGLALDLMEEHRAWLADRVVLSLVNRQQVRASGFRTEEGGGVVMDDATRKAVLVAWQQRKAEEIRHPFLDEKMPIALVPFVQARLFARHLRGDLDGYPPFLWR